MQACGSSTRLQQSSANLFRTAERKHRIDTARYGMISVIRIVLEDGLSPKYEIVMPDICRVDSHGKSRLAAVLGGGGCHRQ